MQEVKDLIDDIKTLSKSASIFTHEIDDKAAKYINDHQHIFLIDYPLFMRIKLMMKQDETTNPIVTIQQLLNNNQCFELTIKYDGQTYQYEKFNILSRDNETEDFKRAFQLNIQKFKAQYKKFNNKFDKEYFTLATLPSGFNYFRTKYSIKKFMELIEDASNPEDSEYRIDLIYSLILYDAVFLDNLHENLIEFGDFMTAFNESIPFMHEIQQESVRKLLNDSEELFQQLIAKIATFLNITWKYSPLLSGHDLLSYKIDIEKTKEKLDMEVHLETLEYSQDDSQKILISSVYDVAFLAPDKYLIKQIFDPEKRFHFIRFGQPLFRGKNLPSGLPQTDEGLSKLWKSITADHKEEEFISRILSSTEDENIKIQLLQIYKEKLQKTSAHISNCIDRFNDKIIFETYKVAMENEMQRLGYALVDKYYSTPEDWFKSVVNTFKILFGRKRIPVSEEFIKNVLIAPRNDAVQMLHSHYDKKKSTISVPHFKFSSVWLKVISDIMKDAALIVFLNKTNLVTHEVNDIKFTRYDQWVDNIFFKEDDKYGSKLLIMKKMEYIKRNDRKDYKQIIDNLSEKFNQVFKSNKDLFASIKLSEYGQYIQQITNSDSAYLTNP